MPRVWMFRAKVPTDDERWGRTAFGTLDRGLPKAHPAIGSDRAGVGDQIMFASCFADLTARAAADGGSVIIECEPRLADLFARSFPAANVRAADLRTVNGAVVADYGWLKAAGGAKPPFPWAACPAICAAHASLFQSLNIFLKPESTEQSRWKDEFAAPGGPVIGLCWRSGKMGGPPALCNMRRWRPGRLSSNPARSFRFGPV